MVYMNELSEMIRDYIHECFDNHNMIPSDDQIYTHFQAYEPSEHIIEKEIHFFFDSYYIFQDTEIKWEGELAEGLVSIQSEMKVEKDAKVS
jgi:hypothetical protein